MSETHKKYDSETTGQSCWHEPMAQRLGIRSLRVITQTLGKVTEEDKRLLMEWTDGHLRPE